MNTTDLIKLITDAAPGRFKIKDDLYCYFSKYASYTDKTNHTYNTDYLCSKITNIRKYKDGTINVAYYNLNKLYKGHELDDDDYEWQYITITPLELSAYRATTDWTLFKKETE